jgi:hypothetical protein
MLKTVQDTTHTGFPTTRAFGATFFFILDEGDSKKYLITKFKAFYIFKHFFHIHFLALVLEICFYQMIRVFY